MQSLENISPSAKSVEDVKNWVGMESVEPESDALVMFTSGYVRHRE